MWQIKNQIRSNPAGDHKDRIDSRLPKLFAWFFGAPITSEDNYWSFYIITIMFCTAVKCRRWMLKSWTSVKSIAPVGKIVLARFVQFSRQRTGYAKLTIMLMHIQGIVLLFLLKVPTHICTNQGTNLIYLQLYMYRIYYSNMCCIFQKSNVQATEGKPMCKSWIN